ncbi:hypothetical protein ABB37_07740 [Leptomonas pyrrhocoris]|uniref:Uncharacterized protein n=1 Tax=Leptomonas pyrrhocoris TaxID=157538 RepID=A0A0M9FUQ0_LEPPY|nr:hypothetical protein ABB37_07740 [Leptomonas pyrrhocoris]KPA76403.1 hypothetical protein ABB37_07740 [Leptomonas pyrrhocoris]|eukprot:XP_015654842.1 hypothetical protein ABB37_07740 [Leptomonas pyrrhocoris]
MSQSTEPLPVRKLCSCNAVLCSPEESTTAPGTDLFGVILLNSPANTAADFAEYVRLFQLYRGGGGGGSTTGGAAPKNTAAEGTSPYFICVDGAYAALKRYCATQAAPSATKEGAEADAADAVDSSAAVMAMRLCDVLIGDMDSLSPAQLRKVVAAAAGTADDLRAPSSTPMEGPLFHETVATIPVALLEDIRQRRTDALRRRGSPDATPTAPSVDTPVVLPIACQLSTDFHKAIALLERLRRLEQGNTETLTEDEQAAYYDKRAEEAHAAEELMKACDAQLEIACEESARLADGDAQEIERCRRLIMDVSPSTSSTVRTRVLPNVAVFGALGGRFDHEIATMVAVMRFARVFHVFVVNVYTVLFACWPDGVTQLLMPPSWSQEGNLARDLSGVEEEGTAAVEPYMSGIVPLGPLREMETTGFLWNVVKNRRGCYGGFTGVEQYRFAFDGLVSSCNKISSRLVTVDVRPTTCDTSRPSWDPQAPSANPPTMLVLGRPKAARKKVTSA